MAVSSQEKLLLAKAKAGDEVSFELLLTGVKTKAYNIALRYLRDPEDAMDASQEVFLRMFRFLSGFQEDSSFSTWLYRIGVNVCKDLLSKRSKRAEQPLEISDEEEDSRTVDIPDGRYDPEQILEGSELRRTLAEAISALPDQQREMIVLRDIQGLSYEEIGQALCLESGTVKSRLFRARENLRKKLLQNGNIFDFSASKRTKGGKTDAIL
jgi:RNA polymerase sigma-70 factor (ECF subfamily)